MFAAVGQSKLMGMWESFFDIYGVYVGQILLTRADTENRHRFLNARDTFAALFNENDAVANEESKVGDNNNLSALAAVPAAGVATFRGECAAAGQSFWEIGAVVAGAGIEVV